MSEVQSRPAASRSRGSGRGGRGGSSRGGSRVSNRTTNGDTKHDADSALPTLEDEGEVGQLKKQYGSKVGMIKEIMPDWSEVDILFALRETDGDENLAVARISEGTISQWDEVSKPKKERARPKGKNDTFGSTPADSTLGGSRPARGGRTGTEGGRGGRGRTTERGGRGGARGKSTVATNGTRAKDTTLSVPTEEASEWNTPKAADDFAESSPVDTASTDSPAAPIPAPAVSKTPENAPKTWASMLRQSTAPKPAAKLKETPAPVVPEPTIEPLPPAEPAAVEPESPVPEEEVEPEPVEEPTPVPPVELPTVVIPEVALLPSKDQLTETNLEQIIDTSQPAPTGTARSEATDSWDPRAQAPSATATPLSASQQQHQGARPAASGFATTANKATERAATRTPSHARRILEQREAVRMPGTRDQVDLAAVKFGAFSLNGPADEDIDGDREEPETRPQPPEDSPVAHPRTSLPPTQPAPIPETYPAQKQTGPLPPTGPAAAAIPTAPQAAPSAPSQAAQPPTAPSAQQYNRFGQPAAPQEPAGFPSSKPYDSFSQQPQQQPSAPAAQEQYGAPGFPSQAQPAQAQAQAQAQQQPGAGAFTSAPGDFSSSYYTAEQGRSAYYQNYQNYAQQQGAHSQQEGIGSQPQRAFSGYNAPQNDNLSQYPQSGAQNASSRFGAAAAADSQITGTPTQAQSTTQAQTAQTTQGQSHGGQQQPHDYPYGSHPYYSSPYYSNYMGYGYGQGGYGGAPYGKGGLGYQPAQYGMSPQGPHGYGSSPAGGFGQSGVHRESGAAAGLGDYGRTASGQASQQQGLGASGFGGMHDTFGRGGSGYQSQAGQSFNAPGSQPGSGPSAADDLKPFGDAKAVPGPSPSLGAAARPGSAANNAQSQTGLPPPQSAQQGGLGGMGGYGGYPSHLQQGHGLHGNQSGAGGYGMSASGGQQGSHQNNYGAGGYGSQQGFSGSYYANPPRGWGTNYH